MLIKRILSYFIIITLLFPALQRITGIISIKPLNGDFKLPEKPVYSRTTFLKNNFQKDYETYTEQRIGFRPLLVRIKNQLDFSLFHMANAQGVEVGTDGNLYEHDYIRAYYGGDFIGKTAIDKKLRRLKFLQTLLKSKGKDFIFVLEPGKASFYPEFIPPVFKTIYKPSLSNYEYIKKRASDLGIRYIDMNYWFKRIKGKTPWPLYPKNGIHWSAYGMYLATDTLVHYIEKLRNIDLPDMVLDRFEPSDSLQETDYDAGKAMNLLFEMSHPKMAYPRFHFTTKPHQQKVSVLTVADSYYWNIFNTRMPKNLFKNEAFWYFNALIYPDTYTQGDVKTENADILAEVEKMDIVFLMVTERFMYKLDWGFIDRLFEAYTPELRPDYQYQYENRIRNFSEWFDMIEKNARMAGIPLEQAIYENAAYVFQNENKKEFLLTNGTDYYKNAILKDPEWINRTKQKAVQKGISFEEMLRLDAEYMMNMEAPDIFSKFKQMQEIADKICKNPQNRLLLKNNPYLLDFKQMLWQEAFARSEGRYLLASIIL